MCTWVECEGRGLCPVASQPVKTERSIADILSGRELARVCRMSDTEEVGQVGVPVAASLSFKFYIQNL